MAQNNAKGSVGLGLTAPVTASITSVSSNITLGDGYFVLLVDTSAARTLTLPSSPTAGRMFIIKDSTGTAETNNITLARAGSESIEGVAANRTLSTNWGVWRIVTNGSNWFIL